MKVGAAEDVVAAVVAVPDSTLPTTMRSQRSARSEPAEHLQQLSAYAADICVPFGCYKYDTVL